MARTIKEIQQQIMTAMIDEEIGLSSSRVAGWRFVTRVVAVVTHAFEVILDVFRAEVDTLTARIIPGTEQWYAEMCRRYQHGHELLYNEKTGSLYYAVDDPDARIIKVVSVETIDKVINIKVGKLDEDDNIVPLTADQVYSFGMYVERFRFAGDRTLVISTPADIVTYNLEVYYDPVVNAEAVRASVLANLAAFRTALSFDAALYSQALADAAGKAEGVVTVAIRGLASRKYDDPESQPVEVMARLKAGYFDYDPDSVLTLTNIKTL